MLQKGGTQQAAVTVAPEALGPVVVAAGAVAVTLTALSAVSAAAGVWRSCVKRAAEVEAAVPPVIAGEAAPAVVVLILLLWALAGETVP